MLLEEMELLVELHDYAGTVVVACSTRSSASSADQYRIRASLFLLGLKTQCESLNGDVLQH